MKLTIEVSYDFRPLLKTMGYWKDLQHVKDFFVTWSFLTLDPYGPDCESVRFWRELNEKNSIEEIEAVFLKWFEYVTDENNMLLEIRRKHHDEKTV